MKVLFGGGTSLGKSVPSIDFVAQFLIKNILEVRRYSCKGYMVYGKISGGIVGGAKRKDNWIEHLGRCCERLGGMVLICADWE